MTAAWFVAYFKAVPAPVQTGTAPAFRRLAGGVRVPGSHVSKAGAATKPQG